MTPREVVLRTLEFHKPPRIPRQLWLLPWASERYPKEVAQIQRRFPDDIVGAPCICHEWRKTVGDWYQPGEFVDEWGCRFHNIQAGLVGEVKEPLIATWDDLGKLREPRELLTVDVAAVNDFCRKTDRFVMAACCPRPFERVQFLRGTENVFVDLATGEKRLVELLARLHAFFMEEFEVWARTEVDALMFMDDWGSQRALLASPRTWRAVFKPLYRDYIQMAHRYGKKVFMHSDGHILEVIPDLVEMGLDALNSQIFCMGVEELGQRFRGTVTFWGEIDRQHLLVSATPTEVAEAVRLAHRSLYHDGGVIAQMEFGAGARPENVVAAFEAWEELGV
jgi:hypothetical protein